ncbi:MAG: hypothetical protein JWO13_52 [Acidobacteriales bacterium]|nr:hypothetical protein [Terriglobales bacterium]
MNRNRIFLPLLLFIASVPSFAQTPATKPQSPLLTTIGWLTGGTWVTETKDEKGDPMRIENRIRWSDNGQLIRFVTSFISHNKAEVHYEGVYAYNPADKQVHFWYTDKDGNLTEGTATMSGETLTQDFTITQLSGKTDKLRSLIVRDSPDSYAWSVLGQREGKWQEIFHLRYMREK